MGSATSSRSSSSSACNRASLTASSESGLSGGILPSIGNAIGSMMRGAVSPLLDLLVGQFGGSWAGKAMTGMVRKAIDAVFSWGDSALIIGRRFGFVVRRCCRRLEDSARSVRRH